MPVDRPTKSECLEWMQATATGLDASLVATKDSDLGIKLRMLAEAIFGLHYEAGKIEDDLFVNENTSTEALDKHADSKIEGGRKSSTIASGEAALTITGDVGSTVEVGDQLTSTDGYRYRLTAGGTIPAAGVLYLSAESIDTGTGANRDVGEVLTFVSPPSGIDATATVAVAIAGAEDQETDAQLIKRLLDAYKNPLGSGRLSDFRQWAMLVAGIVDAYSYGPTSNAPTGRRGLGIVDVAILRNGTGSGRIPSATLQGLVEDAIEARRPATTKEFSVLLPSTTAIDVEVLVTPYPGYEFDWDKEAAVAVFSYTAANRTMVVDDEIADFCVGGRPLAPGDRVLISGANWSEQNTVKTVEDDTPTGKATIVFDNDFTLGTPVNGDEFEPGGPLTAPMLTAMRALFDALGPARGSAYDVNQDWESDALVAAIYHTLMDIEGVQNADIIDIAGGGEADKPATDSAPSGGVELLIYGQLNLRPEL